MPREWGDRFRRAAIDARLQGGSLPVEVGGQGWTVLEQVLVHEQLGQVTGGLWSYIPGAYNVLVHATPISAGATSTRDARRAVGELRNHRGRGRLRCADPEATAVRDAATGECILNGEKWFVTGA